MTEGLEHCSGKEHSKLFYKLVSWSVNFINYNRYICHKPNIGVGWCRQLLTVAHL